MQKINKKIETFQFFDPLKVKMARNGQKRSKISKKMEKINFFLKKFTFLAENFKP